MKLVTFATVALPLVLLAPATFAEPPHSSSSRADMVTAQTLFNEARTLMQRGRFDEACPKLEESQRLDAGIGTQFNLAACYEQTGRIASAWAGFLEVAAQAKAAGQGERERIARKRAHALEPRLPKLVVAVEEARPGLEVKRDEIVIGSAAWGTPIPIDPGNHVITATSRDTQPWTTTVSVAEGKTLHVTVPRGLPKAAAPQAIVMTQSATMPVTDYPRSGADTGSNQRIVGYGVGALGIVGLGVGGYFGLASLNKNHDARSHCVDDVCDAEGVALRDDAIRAGNVATVTTIVGGAMLVGGLVLVLTSPRGTPTMGAIPGTHVHAVPTASREGGGLMIVGRLP